MEMKHGSACISFTKEEALLDGYVINFMPPLSALK